MEQISATGHVVSKEKNNHFLQTYQGQCNKLVNALCLQDDVSKVYTSTAN